MLGDQNRVKCLERRLSRKQLAHIIQVTVRRVVQVENNAAQPTESERFNPGNCFSFGIGLCWIKIQHLTLYRALDY